MGYVYLLLCVESNGVEHHKIGITKNPPIKRVKQLQTFFTYCDIYNKAIYENIYLPIN